MKTLKDYEHFRTSLGVLAKGDCLKLMKNIPDKSIDMILCDLPYGTTQNKWDIVIPFDELWKQYERLIKDNGIIVLTGSQPFTTDLINSNRKLFKYELIYEKTLGSGFLNAKKMPMRYHENILIFYKKIGVYNPIMSKGKIKKGVRIYDNGDNYGKPSSIGKAYNDKGTRYPKSIIRFSTGNRTKNQFHSTQKPVALFEYLIKTYTNKNMLVLDNCIGSGTTAVACEKLNRRWIGIEISEKYCEIAKQRIKNEYDKLKMEFE